MSGEDTVNHDGTWIGHEERVEDTPLIKVKPPKPSMADAIGIVRRLPGDRRRG